MRRRQGTAIAAWAVATAAAFLLLHPVLAAAVAIFGGVFAALAVAAADWDRHSSYEEREMERARRRKEKWAQKADVRARDRARWEAHQARRAQKTDGGDTAA